MSIETDTAVRSNFASRMLSKAIAERTKTGENKKVTPEDAAQYVAADSLTPEVKEAIAAAKE